MTNPLREPDYLPLEELLASFKYKPGWRFSLDKRSRTLMINLETDDSDFPGCKTGVCMPCRIPHDYFDRNDWQNWLRHQILQVEKHEMDEFFQVDGRKPFDPHA